VRVSEEVFSGVGKIVQILNAQFSTILPQYLVVKPAEKLIYDLKKNMM